MRNQKRKFNRTKIIGIIALIISIVMAIIGPVMVDLKNLSPLIGVMLIFFGCVGTGISAFVIVMPDTRENEVSKQILNYFDATHKD